MAQAGGGPLLGLKILDISTVIAGPLSSTLLADLGAEVLKTELPVQGDPMRALAPHKDGVPLWWKVVNRNKKAITLDLRKPEGRTLFERLLPRFDVLVENFRPGTLDKWGLPSERLFAIHPRLTVLRVTGFGQTGPYRKKPGFARVFEAMSGLTNLCGEADRPPVHLGYPIADAVGGLYGAIGILSALYERQRNPEAPGQEIDLSMTEAMFRTLDFLAIEFDQLGRVRSRSGNTSQYAAPSNIYETRDGKWASIAASTQSIFERLCRALSRRDLVEDPRFSINQMRLENRMTLDVLIGEEIKKHSFDELKSLLDQNEVGFSPIYTVEDVFEDPQFTERGAITEVQDSELGPVRMQNVVPRFSRTPGGVASAGPSIGEHNEEIYRGLLGLTSRECEELRSAGVI
jgi:crotonobetainyl-CoA:carnitine CoA-transferase CaiB-like acyl-CoA transferase